MDPCEVVYLSYADKLTSFDHPGFLLSCLSHMCFCLHVILSTCRLYLGIYHLMLLHSLVGTFGELFLMQTCSKGSDIR